MKIHHRTIDAARRTSSTSTPLKKMTGTEDSVNEVYMERTIGLLGGIGLVLGSIIGSGIFISPKGVIKATQSEASALLLWTVGGVISTLGSLSLAELASVIPKSAGQYVYLRVTYAHWVGFLFAWTFGFITKPSAQAVIAMTSAQYIISPFFDDGCGEPPALIIKMLASAIIRHTDYLATGFQDSNTKPGEIIMGFYHAMFAYDGWDSLSYVVEEVKHPKRNIPLSVYIAMPLVTVLYVFVNISYFTVMKTTDILESPAVAMTWADIVLPKMSWLMPVCVALSTFGACNGSIMTNVRFKMKHASRTYKVPLIFPAVLFLFGLTLVIVPLVNSPRVQFLYAALAILIGLFLYLLIVVFKSNFRFMNACPATMMAKEDDETK
ncbi:hypothetical protein LSH36_309g00029 [Paralvinella palmiformis]|uniref:Uncharacterized protein n=1 Tax=Paralvinella palmiformis TaxID=53620 RepID=A0AAD9JH29_9ANNE|nr:hypothetical protein LSH36_309g00029 [Paralvinella palmiformis]